MAKVKQLLAVEDRILSRSIWSFSPKWFSCKKVPMIKNNPSAWERLFLRKLEYKIYNDYSFVSKGFVVFLLWNVKYTHVGLINFLSNHPLFSQPFWCQRRMWLTDLQMSNSSKKAHFQCAAFWLMIINSKVNPWLNGCFNKCLMLEHSRMLISSFAHQL